MTLVCISDPGDELDPILEELSAERRALKYQELADIEGRVTNHTEWMASMRRRRDRIRELEARRDDLIAIEEANAESDWRPAA